MLTMLALATSLLGVVSDQPLQGKQQYYLLKQTDSCAPLKINSQSMYCIEETRFKNG
jgi:hypothetical protein